MGYAELHQGCVRQQHKSSAEPLLSGLVRQPVGMSPYGGDVASPAHSPQIRSHPAAVTVATPATAADEPHRHQSGQLHYARLGLSRPASTPTTPTSIPRRKCPGTLRSHALPYSAILAHEGSATSHRSSDGEPQQAEYSCTQFEHGNMCHAGVRLRSAWDGLEGEAGPPCFTDPCSPPVGTAGAVLATSLQHDLQT